MWEEAGKTYVWYIIFQIAKKYPIITQGGDEAAGGEVPDLAAIKARVREMEEEAEKLKQMQTEVDKQMSMGSPPGLSKYLFYSLL